METTATAEGPVPAEEAWDRYAVPARWPTWAPQITEVDASAPRIAPGVTGHLQAPAGVRLAFTVTEVDEDARTWSWTVRFGLMSLHLQHGVQARDSGSETWLTVRGPALLIASYLPMARRSLQHLVQDE